MPLGDSITSDVSGNGGYRSRVYSELTANGYNVDFVGTRSDSGVAGLPDTDHQGFPGYQIVGIESKMEFALNAVEDPDVILLHAGTNDFTAGATVAEVQARLKSIIGTLSSLRPYAKILVASPILRTDNAATEQKQASFAAALPQLVSEQAALGRRVAFVDQHAALEASDLLENDGVHPNEAGYEKMADTWLASIVAVTGPVGDDEPPAIAGVDATDDLTHVEVKFSKPVSASTVIPSNFAISSGVSVSAADLDSVGQRVVTLTTTPQISGLLYNVAVSGVRDQTGLQNAILPNSTRAFTARSVIDGSFEDDGQGWTVTGSSAIQAEDDATDGTKIVVFNGNNTTPNGTLSQTVSTVAGQKYRLRFDVGINDYVNQVQTLKLEVTGNTLLVSVTEDMVGTGDGAAVWTAKEVEFVADSAQATVEFEDVSTATTSTDLLLDNVRMNAASTPILTVTSSPAEGVSVTVSPADTNSDSDGTTGFTRIYNESEVVTLTAPATFGGKTFDKWKKDGANHSTSASTTVTMDADHTMNAVYKLLVNGSFELGAPDDLGTLDGWTVTGTDTQPPYKPFGYTTNTGYTPSEGDRLAVFNGGSNTYDGAISQTFTTTIGQSYTLSFDLGITGPVGRKQQVLVDVTGSANLVSQAFTVTSTGATTPAAVTPVTFVADSVSTTLTFSDSSSAVTPNTGADLLLDNVSVSETVGNTAPVATDDSYSVTQDVALVIAAPGVLDNDSDSESDPLTATVVSTSSNGTLVLDADGGFTYTPDTGYTGPDSFTYVANDGAADSNTATVSLTVSAAPTTAVANGSFENGAVVSGSVTALDDWTVTGVPFGYIADSAYTSTDGLRIAVFNGGGNTFGGTISQVIATTPGQTYEVEYDAGILGVAGKKQRLMVTVDGTAQVLAQADELTAAGGTGAVEWSTVSYTFVADSATSTLTFTDMSGAISAQAANSDLVLDRVSIVESTANAVPVAVDDSYAVATDGSLVVAADGVLGNDTDANSDPLTAVLVSGVANGTLTLNSDGGFTYQPNASYAGSDTFTYMANDGTDDSNVATVTIVVGDAGDLATNGSFETGAVTTEADTENPGSPGSVTALDDWTVTGGPFGYIATSDYTATEGARLAVFNGGGDGFGGTISQTLTTVSGTTYALTFDAGIFGSAGKKQKLGVTVDGATQVLSGTVDLTAVAGPAQWSPQSFTFTADSASSTLTFTDNSAVLGTQASGCDLLLDNVTVTVAEPNTAPVATDDSYSTEADTALVVAADGVLGNDSDDDSDPLTAVVETTSANGTLTLNPDGGFTYTPNSGYTGPDSFTYVANDGTDDSNIATVTITVTPQVVELVANGSFENGDDSGAPVTVLDDWTVTGNPFGYIADSSYTATDGLRLAVFNGGGSVFGGTISQDITTTPGATYQLSFDAGILGTAGRKQRLTVTADGNSQLLTQNVDLTAVSGPAQWSGQSFLFVANSATTTLTFTDASAVFGSSADGSDLLLDGVSVSAFTGNQGPLAEDDSYSTVEETALVVAAPGVLDNDTDPESDTLTAIEVSAPANGTLVLNSDGSFTYTPDAAFTGTDSFTYKANDGAVDSPVATVTVSVDGGAAASLANGSFEVGDVVTEADPGNPGSPGSVTALDDWTVTGSPFGYIATTAYTATEGSRLAVFNGGGNSFGGTISQTFATVSGEIYQLDFDAGIFGTSGRMQQLGVTVDGGSQLLSETVNLTASGSTAVWAAQSHTFVADGASVTLTFIDNSGSLSGTATANSDLLLDNVSVTVSVGNVAPVAEDDSYSGPQDQPLVVAAPGVLSNDSDANSDPLTATVVSTTSNGTLVLDADGGFTYTPDTGYTGPDSFTYVANDGTVDSNTATVSLTVTVVTPNEVANGSFESGAIVSGSVTALDDWTVSGSPFGYIGDSAYPSTDGLRLAVFNGNASAYGGSISQDITTVPGTAYELTYDAGIYGANGKKQRIQVDVTGAALLLSEEDELVAVGSPASAQYASFSYAFIADSTTTTLVFTDTSGAISGSANGTDLLLDNVRIGELQDVRTLTVNSSPVSGLDVTVSPADLAGNTDGVTSFSRSYADATSVTLTATAASGPHVFEKWQFDGADFSTNPTVTVALDDDHTLTAVYLVDNTPRATDDTFSGNEDTQLVVAAPGVMANDEEPNSLSITAVLDTTTSEGTLSLNSDGGFTYDPDPDFNGTDTFTYHINNGSEDSAVATVTLTIDPSNDDPVAEALVIETDEDTPLAVDLVANDPDDDPLTYTVVDAPEFGTLSGTAPALTYTPDENFNGDDGFTFLVNDGTTDSNVATVDITVVSVEDVPVADPQTLTMVAATTLPITLTGSDGDDDALSFSIVSPPSNGSLTGTPPDVTYVPDQDFTGGDSFTFIANDGAADSDPATVTISVSGVLFNGSFELGTETPDSWTITGTNNEWVTSDTGTDPKRVASDGDYMMVFNNGNGTPDSSVSQTITTTPGQPYEVSFDIGVQAFNSLQVGLQILVQGNETLLDDQDIVTGTNNGGYVVWASKTHSFIADSTSTTLTFTDVSPATNLIDVLLDNISVTPLVTRSLTVDSLPDSGVAVTVGTADIFGDSDGSTSFTREYYDGETVEISVPEAIGAMNFEKWQKDGVDLAVTASVSLTLDADQTLTAVYIANEPPLAAEDTYDTDEDVELLVSPLGVLGNDSDPELEPLTAVLVDDVANGVLVLNSNGGFSYTPDLDFNGADSFTYKASDGVVESDPVTVNITVNAVNDKPVADSQTGLDAVATTEETAVSVTLTGSDVDEDSLTFTVTVSPANGVLTG
ncbi:MAG: Ig-like domain-containing protein, partial [Verrucomicrobiales bacterium]